MSKLNCCERARNLEDIEIRKSPPFSTEIITKPKAYLVNDGGHGGWIEINFCPFCGKKIEIKK